MSNTITINNDNDRKRAVHVIGALGPEKIWDIKISEHKQNRSLAQNRLAFKWYKEIAEQQFESAQNIRRYCKLNFGVPILQRESEEFAAFWESMNLVYEDQMSAMDHIEITRIFKTKQFTEYLSDIERYYRGEGYTLSHPEDLYYQAMGR